MDISVYSLAQVLQFMNDQKYILIEGENGYFRIARNKNMCGIASYFR